MDTGARTNDAITRYLVGDFETTVYEGQESTEVWASALVEIGTENVYIFGSIKDTFHYLEMLNCHLIVYYHNLKFDGHFWLDYIIRTTRFKLAGEGNPEDGTFNMVGNKEMPNNSFSYSISGMGQWYWIKVKINGHVIEFRDSLKLLPFSVKAIGKAFNTKHQKLEIEYEGRRYAGCNITEQEREYIANDVLVVKEALEEMFEQGHNKLTIGACCLAEFKQEWKFPPEQYRTTIPLEKWKDAFPDLTEYELDETQFGSNNADAYVRKAYHGGWCYLVPEKSNTEYHNGVTLDVNSLYPSVMSGESGNYYPFGYPTFYKSDGTSINIPPHHYSWTGKVYYFVRFRCSFELKANMLPTVQIKGSKYYKGTEWLNTSRIKAKDGKYYKAIRTFNGEIITNVVELTMTMTDYEEFFRHYDIDNLTILDYCVFVAQTKMFDMYIDKYRRIKETSTGATRTLAKLFLNNLYGKMATSPNNHFKLCELDEDVLAFHTFKGEDKKVVYVPVGAAVTSYARNFTIASAQANYYGEYRAGFIYADTDSIHCNLPIEQIQNTPLHDTAFCHWKLETEWTRAIFARQKTYMEEYVTEEGTKIDIKCAGMPQQCKDILQDSLRTGKMQFTDFKTGLKVSGKLLPKRIKGGIILTETTFEMR